MFPLEIDVFGCTVINIKWVTSWLSWKNHHPTGI